jgi:long-chain fatty acid transport protein
MIGRKNMNRIGTVFSLAVIFLLFFPRPSFSGGLQGAKASAMATAFVAIADDPSAIAYNPAGLTQLTGTNIYGGPSFVIPSTTYISPSGRSEHTDFQIFFPPHLYVSSNAGTKDMRLGIGIYSPFGIGGRKWDENSLTRFSSVESLIATISINPTVAYQILPTLSIGAGVDFMISKMKSEKRINQSALGTSDGEVTLDALGTGWGYNFGILFTPDRRFSLGVAYRSRIKVTHKGDIELKDIAPALQPAFGGSSFKTDMESPATFPELINFGIAIRPDDKLTVTLEYEWGAWTTFKNADLKLEHEVPAAGFTSSSTPRDWEDGWIAKIGADYQLNDKLSLRGGYAFLKSQVPDSTLDAANPDSNQHNFSIGFGYKMKEIIVDIFYIADFYEDRKIHNNILSGEYENFAHFFGFSIGKKF